MDSCEFYSIDCLLSLVSRVKKIASVLSIFKSGIDQNHWMLHKKLGFCQIRRLIYF